MGETSTILWVARADYPKGLPFSTKRFAKVYKVQ